MMEAQRYPQDFDGIVARAPTANFIGLYLAFNRISSALRKPGATLNVAKRDLLASAVLDQCDSLDGVVDGLISKPAACNYRAAALRCTGGADTGDTCLSDAQIDAVNLITSPFTTSDGSPRRLWH
jgi:tannase/feruloyl esterase